MMNMNLEQEDRLDIREGNFENKPDLISEQTYKDEDVDDVFDEFETNTPGQNVEIKEEIIDCEEAKIEQRSDLPPKINSDSSPGKKVGFCAITIKRELEDISEVKATDTRNIKEYIDEYIQSKVELLTTHCDLPTLKNENTEYQESLIELCDSEENERTPNTLKNNPNVTNIKKRRKQYRSQKGNGQIYFQQGGAPPHYCLEVRQYLNTVFPGQWIGRRGPVEWPGRSPDLTPLDFFLWGHLKSVVYRTPPQSIDDLRNRIIEECRDLTPHVFENIRNAFENRLYYCLNVNGEHFEHLIYLKK
ncbi:unnamed protein product [Psylliodes chrysocephalus]|uniref:Transposase n=1 Tax=Psylliodes chrysocephalus TaxID=3402493 RepID=A0A9P0GGC0_9CUCU|nr:unnamed protein product [Psylliodes chrysocephala]